MCLPTNFTFCELVKYLQMDHQRIPRQAFHWEVLRFKRGPGRPRTNWRITVNKDLLRMGITWEEVEVAAQNRSEWRRSVAQCIHLEARLNQGEGQGTSEVTYYDIGIATNMNDGDGR